MERDFRYLRDKYSDAGAREVFEKICVQLMQSKYKDAYPVAVSQGDGGIDIFVGDYSQVIDVYQCKFFIDGIRIAQQSQIRESFNRAISSDKFKLQNWYLCVPCVLNINEHTWWWSWKKKMEEKHKKNIKILDGSFLIGELKKYDLYNTTFDNETIQLLNQVLISLEETKRYYQEKIYDIDDTSLLEYEDCIFIKKLESARISDNDTCKKEFFNAEIAKSSIESKGNSEDIIMYSQLKTKIQSVWHTQYRQYNDDFDGNTLLSKTYERIEDLDTTTLKASDDITLVAKKGILHQLSDECKVGWLKDYEEKLERFLEKGESVDE